MRQRLFDGGGKALLDHELVEYLLALAIPRRDTKAQAKALLARFGGSGHCSTPRTAPMATILAPTAGPGCRTCPIAVHGLKGRAVIGGRIFLPGGGITLGGNSGTNAMQVYRTTMRCD